MEALGGRTDNNNNNNNNQARNNNNTQWEYSIDYSEGTSKFESLWKQQRTDTTGGNSNNDNNINNGRANDNVQFQFVNGASTINNNNGVGGGGRVGQQGRGGVSGSTNNNNIIISLSNIRAALDSTSSQYQQRETLPNEPPAEKPIVPKSNNSGGGGGGVAMNNNSCSGLNPYNNSSSSATKPPRSNHNNNPYSQNSNNKNNDTNNNMRGNNSSSSSPKVPYKTAADYLLTQDPTTGDFDYNDLDDDIDQIQQQPHQPPPPRVSSESANQSTSRGNNNHNTSNNNSNFDDEFDNNDDDDDMFGCGDDELAALDVNQIISQKPQHSQPSPSAFGQQDWQQGNYNNNISSARAPLRTMNCGSSSAEYVASSGMAGAGGYNNNSNNNGSGYNNNRGGDYGSGYNNGNGSSGYAAAASSRNSYPPDYTSSGANTFGESYDNYNNSRHSAGGATFGESFDINFGNNGQSNQYNDGYNQYQNDYNNGGGNYNGFDNTYDIGGGGGGYNNGNNYASAASDGVPLCPGHNKPCITLTSNTQDNPGRQFYKCSMPDNEKCDFFEWVDGMESNGNNAGMYSTSYDEGGGGGGYQANSGDTKNYFSEVRQVFGHSGFRPGQQEVIEQAMNGNDVFVLMPTGGGKSLCYQLPAWCCPGISVVISPLLSLIEDQVQSMTKLGVQSVFLNSTQQWEGEQQNIISNLNNVPAHGGIKLLYITPEKLTHSNMIKGIFKTLSNRGLISRFVVDEAHCLSDW